MKTIKGETKFKDVQDEVITTFVSVEGDEVVATFDTKDQIKMKSVVINENGNIKVFNKDLLNTIPEEWNNVIECMTSLTTWYKLDTKGE